MRTASDASLWIVPAIIAVALVVVVVDPALFYEFVAWL